jgi:hypothetical protein
VLARLVLVGRLVWLLLVIVNLRPHYFSCSPGFCAWGSVYLLVVCIGCSTSTSNVDGPLEAVSNANTNPSFPIDCFEQSSSHINRIYTFLFVKKKKSNENHVILINTFPHLQATSSRTYSDGLDPTGHDLWQKLLPAQISDSTSQEKNFFQTSWHMTYDTDNKPSNCSMIRGWFLGKDSWRNRSCHYFGLCLQRLRQTTKHSAAIEIISAEFWKWYRPNTIPELLHYARKNMLQLGLYTYIFKILRSHGQEGRTNFSRHRWASI